MSEDLVDLGPPPFAAQMSQVTDMLGKLVATQFDLQNVLGRFIQSTNESNAASDAAQAQAQGLAPSVVRRTERPCAPSRRQARTRRDATHAARRAILRSCARAPDI